MDTARRPSRPNGIKFMGDVLVSRNSTLAEICSHVPHRATSVNRRTIETFRSLINVLLVRTFGFALCQACTIHVVQSITTSTKRCMFSLSVDMNLKSGNQMKMSAFDRASFFLRHHRRTTRVR